MLTENQKHLIRESFAAIAPAAEDAAALFYARLFEINPFLKRLFHRAPIEEQGRKLMQTLAVAVQSLDRLHTLIEPLRMMGRRHAGYGVQDEHYENVADALLWTLQTSLKDRFTEQTRDAWIMLLLIVSAVMKEGARQHQEATTLPRTA